MKKWIVERRPLGQDAAAATWEHARGGDTLQEAVWHYNRLAMCIHGHEQRLMDPSGHLVLHHRHQNFERVLDLSPPPWRERWRDLLLPD